MSELRSIKDKARQAYRDQQTQDTEGGVPCSISFITGYLEGYRELESEKAALERGIREWQSIHKQCLEKLEIAVEALERLSKITVLAESAKDIINEALARIKGKE